MPCKNFYNYSEQHKVNFILSCLIYRVHKNVYNNTYILACYVGLRTIALLAT
jgi:hypothetical protein